MRVKIRLVPNFVGYVYHVLILNNDGNDVPVYILLRRAGDAQGKKNE